MKILPVLPVSLLFAAAAARAADPLSIEDRLRALESRVNTLEHENAALRQQLAAPAKPSAIEPVSAAAATAADRRTTAAAPVTVRPQGRETRLTIGGYTQAQAEFGDAGDARFAGINDRIYFRRARVNITGSFDEHFSFKVDGEYGSGANSAATGLRMQANEVYLSWDRYPEAGLRVGQLKTAFSAELLGVEYKGAIIERSLGAERIGDGRQLAFQVAGDLFGDRVSYLVLAGNGNGSNASANDNSKFLQSAHVGVVVHDSLAAGHFNVGGSALRSTDNGVSKPGPGFDATPGGALDNLFVGKREGWGLDAAWKLGLFDFTTELLRMRYRPSNAVPASTFVAESWQGTAAYFVIPTHLQAAVRRDHYDPNLSLAGDSTDTWWVGLNYYFKGDDLKFMVDYLFGRAAGRPDDRGRLLTRFQVVY